MPEDLPWKMSPSEVNEVEGWTCLLHAKDSLAGSFIPSIDSAQELKIALSLLLEARDAITQRRRINPLNVEGLRQPIMCNYCGSDVHSTMHHEIELERQRYRARRAFWYDTT